MKVLVTGARGLLGADLLPLLAAEHDIIPVDIEDFDITQAHAVHRALRAVAPAAVVHCAAYTQVDRAESDTDSAWRVNVLGTANVAAAAAEIDAWLIVISTDFVFDGRKSDPYREEDPPYPLCHYGATKLMGELMAWERCRQLTILRTAWLYGHGGPCFPRSILRQACAGNPLRVVNDQCGSPTWARDLSQAIAAVLRCGARGLYHAAGGGGTSWCQFARAILDLAGYSSLDCAPIGSEDLALPATRPRQSRLDTSKLAQVAGFQFRHWRDALEDFFCCHPQFRTQIMNSASPAGGSA